MGFVNKELGNVGADTFLLAASKAKNSLGLNTTDLKKSLRRVSGYSVSNTARIMSLGEIFLKMAAFHFQAWVHAVPSLEHSLIFPPRENYLLTLRPQVPVYMS